MGLRRRPLVGTNSIWRVISLFSRCEILWIDESIGQKVTRSFCRLYFPVLQYVYMAFEQREIDFNKSKDIQEIIGGVEAFAKSASIARKARIAIIIHFSELISQTQMQNFMEKLEKRLRSKAKAR